VAGGEVSLNDGFFQHILQLAAALAFALLQFVKDHLFLVDGPDPTEHGPSSSHPTIYQSDVTTLVSLIHVLRTLSSCWLGLASWRMAFICPEKHGANFEAGGLDCRISHSSHDDHRRAHSTRRGLMATSSNVTSISPCDTSPVRCSTTIRSGQLDSCRRISLVTISCPDHNG